MSIEQIKKDLKSSAELKIQVANTMAEQISEAIKKISASLKNGRKIMLCGNGGSAADSQHLATELVVRLTEKVSRKALPAIALTTDTSTLTAAANDFGFDSVFARQVEAHGAKGDILMIFSTSGNSSNVIKAVETAKNMEVETIGMLGKDGGKLKTMVDLPLVIPSDDTQRIQEAHITIGHIIIQAVEKRLFK